MQHGPHCWLLALTLSCSLFTHTIAKRALITPPERKTLVNKNEQISRYLFVVCADKTAELQRSGTITVETLLFCLIVKGFVK